MDDLWVGEASGILLLTPMMTEQPLPRGRPRIDAVYGGYQCVHKAVRNTRASYPPSVF